MAFRHIKLWNTSTSEEKRPQLGPLSCSKAPVGQRGWGRGAHLELLAGVPSASRVKNLPTTAGDTGRR